MSNPALNWALAQRLDPRDKFVLVALANRARPKADAAAGHRHTCNPSIACVATDTGLSERGVQRALMALRRGGLVTIEGRGGRHLVSLYHLDIGNGAPPSLDENGDSVAPFSDERGKPRSPLPDEKGDSVTPFPDEKGDSVAPFFGTSDAPGPERVTGLVKRVTPCHPEPIEPKGSTSSLRSLAAPAAEQSEASAPEPAHQERDGRARLDLGDGDAPFDARTAVRGEGVAIFRRLTGKSEKLCQALIGKFLRDLRDDCAVLLVVLRDGEATRPADPISWIGAAVGARKRAQGVPPRRDMPFEGAARFAGLPDLTDVDGHPGINGWQIDVIWEGVAAAARINPERWPGRLDALAGWLRDDIAPGTIYPTIERVAARPGYSPPRSLGYFDAAYARPPAARRGSRDDGARGGGAVGMVAAHPRRGKAGRCGQADP